MVASTTITTTIVTTTFTVVPFPVFSDDGFVVFSSLFAIVVSSMFGFVVSFSFGFVVSSSLVPTPIVSTTTLSTYDFYFVEAPTGFEGMYNVIRQASHTYTANITPAFNTVVRVETKGFNSQVHCFESSLIVSNICNLKNHIYILYKIICKLIVYKQNKSCIMLQWI